MRANLEQRLARLEARESIRQLATDYARLLDADDVDALTDLFVDHVRVGDEVAGRPSCEHFA